MDQSWPFSDPPNVVAFVSRLYFQSDPICRVYHDWEDGAWQFHPKHEASDSGIMIVTLEEVLTKDASIGDLADLPYGWMAERSAPNNPWKRSKHHPYPEHSHDGFYLDDATKYPAPSSVPDKTTRENLPAGERVKLIFRFAAETAPRQDNECERMWVEVLDADTDHGYYRGRLLNQPRLHSAISEGHELWFHPIHVFAMDDGRA